MFSVALNNHNCLFKIRWLPVTLVAVPNQNKKMNNQNGIPALLRGTYQFVG